MVTTSRSISRIFQASMRTSLQLPRWHGSLRAGSGCHHVVPFTYPHTLRLSKEAIWKYPINGWFTCVYVIGKSSIIMVDFPHKGRVWLKGTNLPMLREILVNIEHHIFTGFSRDFHGLFTSFTKARLNISRCDWVSFRCPLKFWV